MAGQERGLFLQDFGKDLKVCLAILVGKLSRRQLHLEEMRGLAGLRTGSSPPFPPPSGSQGDAAPAEKAGGPLTKEMPRLHTSARMS